MLITFSHRASDSPVVERVWRSHSERAGVFHSVASCYWNMVVTRLQGGVSFTIRGPESRATLADLPPDGEWFGVHFKLGTFMPAISARDFRDRQDLTLPNAGSRRFWLDGSAWEYPTFENVDTFVNRLVQRSLIVTDPVVKQIICGEALDLSTRTEQRRFQNVTGLTRGTMCQIARARRAALLLQNGMPILDVVHGTGYFDQAHLTRSMQRFIGQSPARIANRSEQLSLLYNQ